MKRLNNTFHFCCIILLCNTITSCYVHTKVASINKENIQESKIFVIESPAKAHLTDGSLIIFAQGLEIRNNTLKGKGIRYDLSCQNHYRFSEITMDSVACLKCYEKEMQFLPSVMLNPFIQFVSIFELVEHLTYSPEEEQE